MATLAIEGHKTRGKEVIEILEMLGGKNQIGYSADCDSAYFYIGSNSKNIYYFWFDAQGSDKDFTIYSLEEFLEKFPYKVGDKVIIKRKNKEAIIDKVSWCCDTITYWLKYDGFIEGNWRAEHLQPYKEETIETITIDDFKANTKEWLIDKLESMSRDNALQAINNIYDELHKSQYPKTYEECCKVLNTYCTIPSRPGYKEALIAIFQDLLICRDAYWKIAGEKMGLGKPWKPDWNESSPKYTITVIEDKLVKNFSLTQNYILAFPTEEMRDAFYENFKDLMEQCKELL